MAQVSVSAEDVDQLKRGGVCAKTGLPATQAMSMRAVHTPNWIWILILFGLFPYLIAYIFTKQEVAIQVPASAEAVRHRFQATAMMVTAGLISAGFLIAAAFATEPALAWVGVVGLVLVVMALPFWARTWITTTFDGDVVTLSRVHPGYVAAVESHRTQA